MMNCDRIRDQFGLLLYGELSFDEEETVETHLDTCAECRKALGRQRELHAAFDRIEIEPPQSLLRECRATLRSTLAQQSPIPESTTGHKTDWWDRFIESITHPQWVLRPAGALSLLALGFLGARMTTMLPGVGGFVSMGMGDASSAHVSNVEAGPNGRIQIVVDETRQKIISGGLDDKQVRAMLLSAARDSTDPGVRAETVELLTAQAGSGEEIRDVLIAALKHDQNAGVRLKAMAGLKQFAGDPSVRKAMSEVLMSDSNPGVRSQAIDLLTQGLGPAVDQDLVGAFQELMRRENNPYVRERVQNMLASWNASPEIY
jgi:HEAT repeats/Putative zinc-finger